MSESKILWTNKTWNPVIGCRKASPGCAHCYALRMARRLASGLGSLKVAAAYKEVLSEDGREWNGNARYFSGRLTEPLRWRKPYRCFPCSMSDLFLDNVNKQYRAAMYGIMAIADKHTFQVLTKRPYSITSFYRWASSSRRNQATKYRNLDRALATCLTYAGRIADVWADPEDAEGIGWPLSNVGLGTTIENQSAANCRLPGLRLTPAAFHFLSVEPLLSPIDFSQVPIRAHDTDRASRSEKQMYSMGQLFPGRTLDGIDWIIVGGESGPNARAMRPDWARSIRDQVLAQKRPPALMFKQWGKWQPLDQVTPGGIPAGKRIVEVEGVQYVDLGKDGGRHLDGKTWTEYPEDKVAL